MTTKVQEQDKVLCGDVLFENVEIVSLSEAEQKASTRLLKLQGIASRGGLVNDNDRMYPTEVLNKAVEEAQTKIKQGKFLGEVDHPDFGSGSLKNVALKFTKLWMEGDLMRFEADVVPTEQGQLLNTLVRSGIVPGISTRGYGSVLERDINGRSISVIQDDYRLLGIDAVLEESNKSAGILSYENKGGSGMSEKKTIESLKAEYPELFEEFEKAMRESIKTDLEAEFSEKVKVAIEEKKEEWKSEAQKDLDESEEVKNLRGIVSSILEAVKPLLPEVQTNDEELKIENEQLKQESVKQAEKIAKLEEANSTMTAQIQERETREKVMAKVEEKVKDHKYESMLRERLVECKTEEEVESKFEQDVALIEKLVTDKKVEVPTGAGKANVEGSKVTALDEAKKRQRELAGV